MIDLVVKLDFSSAVEQFEAQRERVREAAVAATAESLAVVLGKIRLKMKNTSMIGLADNQPSAYRERGPVTIKDGLIRGLIGSTHPGAHHREVGGTIRPGKSPARGGPRKGQPTKALTIPQDAALTKLNRVARAGRVATAGGAENFGPMATEFFARGQDVFGRLVEGLVRPAKTGRPRQVTVAKKNARTLFLLARSVTTKAQPVLEGVLDDSRTDISAIYQRRILGALSE